MTIECTPENPCVVMQLHSQKSSTHDGRMDKMDLRMDKMTDSIEHLKNRLPLWATGAFTGAGLAIGSLSTLLLVVKH